MMTKRIPILKLFSILAVVLLCTLSFAEGKDDHETTKRGEMERIAGRGATLHSSADLLAKLQECKALGFDDLADDILYQIGLRYAFFEEDYKKGVEVLQEVIAEQSNGVRYLAPYITPCRGFLPPEPESLKQYYQQHPHFIADCARIMVAQIYMIQEKNADAIRILENMVDMKISKGELSETSSLMESLVEKKQDAKLSGNLEVLIRTRPDKRALRLLTLCYLKRGEEEKSKAIYRQAMRSFPKTCRWAEEELDQIKKGNRKKVLGKIKEETSSTVPDGLK